MRASPSHYGLVLLLLVVAGSTGMDEAVEGKFVFVPHQFWTCAENFVSHAELSVDQCKGLCLAQAGCTEFSFPLDEAPSGCRIAKQGGCEARPFDNELYSVYKRQLAPTDEPPDLEGVGARRRRRSDARRRTHNPEKTSASTEIALLKAKVAAAAKAEAEAAAARARGQDEAILYNKENLSKAKVTKLKLDWKIRQAILNAPKKTKKKSQKKNVKTLKQTVQALAATASVMKANIRSVDNAMEATESQKSGVLQKILLAKNSIEKLMDDPGKLADQDRQIAIAILGKLRVAKALINGDMVSLNHEQKKLPWVVRLREATEKALRHPSKANLEAAEEAYKQAAASNDRATSAESRAERQEQTRLADEAKAAREAAAMNSKNEADKIAAAKEAAKIETAKKQAAADQAAAQAAATNAIAVPSAAAVAPVAPVLPDPPIIKKVKRGFFDPIE